MVCDHLDPVTGRKLREFARRRRVLLAMRAVFAGVLTLLVAMAGVALIDRMIVLSQSARLVLSLAAYLGVVVVVYRVGLRYLLRSPSAAQIARMIEAAEPSLREDLVSAVELAEDPSAIYDSAVFRSVLQRNVARRVSTVNTDRVLPWRMIAWWAGVSTGAVVLTVVLILTPGLRYADLLTRALLPTADLDRVSDVQITLLSPDLGERGRVPMNAPLPIEVQVVGGSFDKVTAEVSAPTRGGEALAMRPVDDAGTRYAVDLPVGDQPLRFRVMAGDGQTRYYELLPKARPAVVRFSQVIQPPAYTDWPTTRRSSDEGAIDAWVGSVVDLTLKASEPIERGNLIILSGEDERRVPLYVDPADATVLTTSLPIDQSGAYRVDLVAKQTQFDSGNAQRYEITARPDALPSIELVTPEGTDAQRSDAIVQLIGRADDDVGLRDVVRQARINGGAWSDQPVQADARGAIASAMDLFAMDLQAGDEVELRLVATDLAGQQAHSVSARLLVTPDGLDFADQDAIQNQRALLTALARALGAAQRTKAQYAGVDPGAGIAGQQAQTQARIARSALLNELRRVSEATDRAFATSDAGAQADLIMGVGRAVAEADAALVLLGPAVEERELLERANQSLAEIEQALQSIHTMMRARVDAFAAASVVEQAMALETELARIGDRAAQDARVDETLAADRMRRRLSITAIHAQALTDRLDLLAVNLGNDPYRDRLNESAARLLEPIRTLREVLDPPAEIGPTQDSTQTLRSEMSRAQRQLWPAWSHLADQDRDAQRRQPKPIPLDSQAIVGLAQRVEIQALQRESSAVADRLRRRASLEEQRPLADNTFIALTGMTARAIEQAVEQIRLSPDPMMDFDSLRAIANAYDTIERTQTLADLRTMVVALADGERHRITQGGAALAHRLAWSAIESRFDAVARTLDPIPALRDASVRTREAERSNARQWIVKEFRNRHAVDYSPESVADELDALAQMLGSALREAEPALDDARKTLSGATPTLAEQMRELAEQARALAERSRIASDEALGLSEPEVIARAEVLAEQQDRLNDALATLSEAMRREANRQDLMTEQGRAAARDYDDAIAMLKPDAQQAEQQLDLAQRQTTREHERPNAIEAAADAQVGTAEALEQIAEHLDNLDADHKQAEASRQALRAEEDELGITDELDALYERMERLAELSQLSDADRLAALEQQLSEDQAMQRELDRIADDLSDLAQQRLADAARTEGEMADALGETAEAEQRLKDPAERAIDQLADQARRLDRDRVDPLAQLAQRGAPEAREEIQSAEDALERAAAQAQQNEQRAAQYGEAQEQRDRAQELADATREAADQLAQAAADARAAEQDARQRHDRARAQADQANQEGVAAPEAAREVIESSRQRQRAERVREESQDIARRANDLAQRAETLDEQMQQADQQVQAQRGQAGGEQAEIADQAKQAAEELDRAARHEQRLGDTPRAEQLAESGQAVRALAEQDLPDTGERIARPGPTEQAEQAARDAEQALREQAQALDAPPQQAQNDSTAPAEHQDGEGQSSPPLPQPIAESLARELDQLDARLNSSQTSPQDEGQPQGDTQRQGQAQSQEPGQGEGQGQQAQGQGTPGNRGPGQAPPGSRPIDRAAQAQAQAIREARSGPAPPSRASAQGQADGQQPGQAQSAGDGLGVNEAGGPARDGAPLGDRPGDDRRAWGDLPPRIVEDLSRGQRERAPAEYLDQVDAYFRAIAQRSREQDNE